MLNPYVLDLTLLGQIKKNQTDIAHSLTFATSWSCTTETYVWPTGAKFVGTYQNNQKHGGLLSTFWCTSALQSCVANEFVWKWATVIDGYRCLSVYHHFTMIFINSYTDWWFGTFFICPYIGNTHPNWLIFFRGLKPPTSIDFSPSNDINWRYTPLTERRDSEVMERCIGPMAGRCLERGPAWWITVDPMDVDNIDT